VFLEAALTTLAVVGVRIIRELLLLAVLVVAVQVLITTVGPLRHIKKFTVLEFLERPIQVAAEVAHKTMALFHGRLATAALES
jgi:hypothetical protein